MNKIYLTLHDFKNQTFISIIPSFLKSKKIMVYFLINLGHLKD